MTPWNDKWMTEEQRFSAGSDYIHLLIRLAANQGIDIPRVYRETGFNPKLLEHAGARLNLGQVNLLWQKVEEINTDPCFGLKLGRSACDYPGHILLALFFIAPTVQKALDALCGNYEIINDMIVPEFFIQNGQAVIRLKFNITQFIYTHNISEGFLSFYASILRRLTENRIQFDRVSFTHQKPRFTVRHHEIFGAPSLFDQAFNQITFDASHLNLPLYFSHPVFYADFEDRLRKIRNIMVNKATFSAQVAGVIKDMNPVMKTDIHSVCESLNISKRTLQKQLGREGTTFRKLVEDVRKEQALYLLSNTDIPLVNLSYVLGYSEQSAFTRAFKKWTGISPGEFRANGESQAC